MTWEDNKYFMNEKSKCVFYPSDIWTEDIETYVPLKEWCKEHNKDFIDFSLYESQIERYVDYPQNFHHFTLKTQYDLFLPMLNDLLHFGFNKDDFDIIPYFDSECEPGKTFDLSYLFPKDNSKIFVIQKTSAIVGGFNALLGLKNQNELTKYHNIFRFPHQSCRIYNTGANNGKRLLLSGDSQNIPQLPILAYYYKEIYYLDTRNMHCGFDFDAITYDDILFSFFEKFSMNKYLNINFYK